MNMDTYKQFLKKERVEPYRKKKNRYSNSENTAMYIPKKKRGY